MGTLREFLKKFWPSLNAYRTHRLRQKWSTQVLKTMTDKLSEGEVLLGIDPSENPKWLHSKMHLAQYLDRDSFTLIPMIAMWSVLNEATGEREVVRVSFPYLSEGGKHNPFFLKKVLQDVVEKLHGMTEGRNLAGLEEKYRLKSFKSLHLYTDNASKDLKNKTIFFT